MSVFNKTANENAGRAFGFPQIVVVLLLGLSAITNGLLVFKVRELRGVITALKSEETIQVGTHLGPLTAQDLTGQGTAIRFSDTDRPTLLYVFSPSCGWCKKNEENIKSLVNQTGDKIRMVGVSLSREGLDEYLRARFPQVKVVTPDARSIATYKLSGTPETILVSSDGVVLKVWKGAFSDSLQREVEDYFRIKLPGLPPTSQAQIPKA